MNFNPVRRGLGALTLLLPFVCAHAQDAQDTPQPGPVTITGSLRSRLYAWDWFEPSVGNNEYFYSGNVLRINFAQQRSGWDWDAEFELPFLLGLPTGATVAPPQGALGLGANYFAANHSNQYAAMLFPKQLYLRFDSLDGDPRQSLQLGRFLFLDGNELTPKNATLAAVKQSRINARLIGDFVWSDVGRAFDGVHYSFSTPDSNVTLLAVVPTRGVFQVDGWGWNDIAFAYASYSHDWGSGRHAADTRVFFIEYDDWRPDLKIDNRPLALRLADQQNLRINTFGAHTLHTITNPSGPVDLLAWGAVQTGRWGALAQRAYAADLEAGWQPAILPRLKPWLRSGYTIGSGDGNPNDKTHGTFFQLLPTPRIYARFPFYNMMNTEDLYGILLLRPHPKLTISSEFHSLRLANPNDLWYSGGGAFQPWTFGYIGRPTSGRRSLGNLYDTNFEYRANRNITFTAYLGYTQGLAVMEHIYPQGKNGQFGYLELLYRFQ